jgi:hypothetical protein
MNQISQEEFDKLAIFVSVTDELKKEPFFSEDNHDHLTLFKDETGQEIVTAFFCHPAFLKSSGLPFRKLWLNTEHCA